jgi:hypothetical protein
MPGITAVSGSPPHNKALFSNMDDFTLLVIVIVAVLVMTVVVMGRWLR